MTEKDKAIIEQLEKMDYNGLYQWPEMSALAEDLEDPELREKWQNICKGYAIREKCSYY